MRILYGLAVLWLFFGSPAQAALSKDDMDEIRRIIREELAPVRQEIAVLTTRVDQMEKRLDGRIDDTNRRIDDTNRRIDDLKFYFTIWMSILTLLITSFGLSQLFALRRLPTQPERKPDLETLVQQAVDRALQGRTEKPT
jgi:hypothetical protein